MNSETQELYNRIRKAEGWHIGLGRLVGSRDLVQEGGIMLRYTANFAKDFHVFAVEWRPDEIIWYVDGVERFRSYDGIPEQPMYILMNLAVGGNWPGSPDAETPFSCFFEVDYVRVYKKD